MPERNRESEHRHTREILFVDDEKGVRDGWKRFLSAKDRTVITAADGESAISGLARHPVDLVISDLRMPGVDGLDLLKWVHENSPDTRFVLITGYGSKEVERKARNLGAFGYLEKPIRPDELTEIAEAALRGDPSTWKGAIAVDAIPTAEAEEVKALAAEASEPVAETEQTTEQATSETTQLQLTLRDLGKLAAAPFMGLAFIVFMPIVGIGAAFYGIGVKVADLVRPSRRRDEED